MRCWLAALAVTASGSTGCGRIAFGEVAAGDGGGVDDGALDGDAAVDAVLDPLAELNDDFEGASLAPEWSVLNPSDASYVVQNGELVVTATTVKFWFDNDDAIYFHVPVTGDFIVTTTVRVDNPVTPGVSPSGTCLGIAMARDPASPPENHVWVGIGAALGEWSIEPKNTVNDVTMFQTTPWGLEADVRICRLGSAFRLLGRVPGTTTWTLDAEHVRTDLPATLQVGISAGCLLGPTDFVARFEHVTFATPSGDCLVP